jgi:hypothetical protein
MARLAVKHTTKTSGNPAMALTECLLEFGSSGVREFGRSGTLNRKQ